MLRAIRVKILGKTFSVLGLLVLVVGVGLAQDHPAANAQPADAQQSRKSPSAPEALKEHGSKGTDAEPQEEDQKAQFKKSGAVRMIAKLTNMEVERAYWLADIINFLVIVAILGWAARKVLPKAFRDRTAMIQKAMQEAQKASEEARRTLAEIESRLAKLDVEIAAMRDAAEKDAAAEEARIKAAAEEDARKIVASAEQEISAAAKAARRQLTAHAADLAVGLAQKQIRIDAVTDKALVRNFAGELGAASDNQGKDQN